MNWILAVDFGTSNTAAAMRHPDGRVSAIKLDTAGDTMPSSVIVTDRGFRVGQAALNARRSYPDGFVGSPKERLGRGAVLLADQEIQPSALVAQVLTAARDRSLRTAGAGMPARLVLTHPVRWGRQRLDELLDAARQAGFDPQRIYPLPEPIAALHAHVSPKTLPPGARVAVVDVGGGTSDVAILQATGDPTPGKDLVVVAQDGDDRLGGNDLDAILMDWVRTQLNALGRSDVLTALDDPRNLGSLLTLRDIVRGAKQDLSEHADAPVGVSVGGLEIRLTVTRDEYEQLIKDSVTRMAALVNRAMAASDTKQGLAGLYLTGGTAYTPALARALHSATGILAAPMGDPKLATALGALRTPMAIMGIPGGTVPASRPGGPVGGQQRPPVMPTPQVQPMGQGRPPQVQPMGQGRPPQVQPMGQGRPPQVQPMGQGRPPQVQPMGQNRPGTQIPMGAPSGPTGARQGVQGAPPAYGAPQQSARPQPGYGPQRPYGPGTQPSGFSQPAAGGSGKGLIGWVIGAVVLVAVVIAIAVLSAILNAADPNAKSSSGSVGDENTQCWDGSSGVPCTALEGELAIDYLFAETAGSPERTCEEQNAQDSLPPGALELYGCWWDDLDDTGLMIARYKSVDEAESLWSDYLSSNAVDPKESEWAIPGEDSSGMVYSGMVGDYYLTTYCYDQVPFCAEAISLDELSVGTASDRWAPLTRGALSETVATL